mmetsp:Transcript_16954/g.42799  ORF Transcript_16954/g.42799 Transcript_16954/m.42799 type:complete len:550 (+) Transcript_16954:179-1828(+)
MDTDWAPGDKSGGAEGKGKKVERAHRPRKAPTHASGGGGGSSRDGAAADARILACRLSRENLEDLVCSSLASKKALRIEDLRGYLDEAKHNVVIERPKTVVGQDETAAAAMGLFSPIPSSSVVQILKQLPLQKRLSAIIAVCKGFRVYRNDPELFTSLIFTGGYRTPFSTIRSGSFGGDGFRYSYASWTNGAGLNRLLRDIVPKDKDGYCSGVKELVLSANNLDSKVWVDLFKMCNHLERVRFAGKKVGPTVMKMLEKTSPDLESLDVSFGNKVDLGMVTSLLAAKPRLKEFHMDRFGWREFEKPVLQLIANALSKARSQGEPLLETLTYQSDMTWEALFSAGDMFPEINTIVIGGLCDSYRRFRPNPNRAFVGALPENAQCKPLRRLERLKIDNIGTWGERCCSPFPALPSANLHWIVRHLFTAAASTIVELYLDVGSCYISKKERSEGNRPPDLPKLGGALQSLHMPCLRRISLGNMVVAKADIAPPFSAPSLQFVSLSCQHPEVELHKVSYREALQYFLGNPDGCFGADRTAKLGNDDYPPKTTGA